MCDYRLDSLEEAETNTALTTKERDRKYKNAYKTLTELGYTAEVFNNRIHRVELMADKGQYEEAFAFIASDVRKQGGILTHENEIAIKEVEDGLFEADTPYLTEALASGEYTEEFLLEQPLYPDQMVFLIGTFGMDKAEVEEGQCVAYSDSGKVLMRMDSKKAQVLAETLTAVVFVISHIKAAGHPLSTMGEKAKSFIANWESEKYRKSLAGKK